MKNMSNMRNVGNIINIQLLILTIFLTFVRFSFVEKTSVSISVAFVTSENSKKFPYGKSQ